MALRAIGPAVPAFANLKIPDLINVFKTLTPACLSLFSLHSAACFPFSCPCYLSSPEVPLQKRGDSCLLPGPRL